MKSFERILAHSVGMDTQKLQELIVYLGVHPKVNDLGLTKLWKLIYFVDVAGLRELGHSVTGSEFIKYPHGPVPSRGERNLKKLEKSEEVATESRLVGDHTMYEVRALRDPELSTFTKAEKALIDKVCTEYGRLTAKRLSVLSHYEPAWHYAKNMEKLSPQLMAYGREEDPDGL